MECGFSSPFFWWTWGRVNLGRILIEPEIWKEIGRSSLLLSNLFHRHHFFLLLWCSLSLPIQVRPVYRIFETDSSRIRLKKWAPNQVDVFGRRIDFPNIWMFFRMCSQIFTPNIGYNRYWLCNLIFRDFFGE